jgi:catechol 2,3-dioxygenase-like lactoylglutathione lyase family enzyme
MQFLPHHTAISVRDPNRTIAFYRVFGFEEVHRYQDEDKTGIKLKLGNYVLELFAYKRNRSESSLALELGNNLAEIGVKHIGFTVEDIDAALIELQAAGLADRSTTILSKGSARFFFVKDPDGMWVEVIHDDRY